MTAVDSVPRFVGGNMPTFQVVLVSDTHGQAPALFSVEAEDRFEALAKVRNSLVGTEWIEQPHGRLKGLLTVFNQNTDPQSHGVREHHRQSDPV